MKFNNVMFNDAITTPLKERIVELETALGAVMGDIDFTKGACQLTDMVGACLSKEALALAHKALEKKTFGRTDQK